MRCNRAYNGTYEAYDWVIVNSNTVQLKGSNVKFVSSENGTIPLTCNRVIADL